MSTFIRRYGRYLNEKAFAYRQMAFDFTRVKKGYVNRGYHSLCWTSPSAYQWDLVIHQFTSLVKCSFSLICTYLALCAMAGPNPGEYLIFSLLCPLSAEGVMRTMTTEKLLKGMPVLQTQIDTLLEFDVSPTLAWFLPLFYLTALQGGFSVIWKPLSSLSFLPSGSSQGAEQWNYQCCIYASLQGPGQTVCILQWRHHQPIRWVVHEYLLLGAPKITMNPNLQTSCVPYIEKYFKMKKSDCKDALEIYKRFLTRVTKIGEFMKLAEVGQSSTLPL